MNDDLRNAKRWVRNLSINEMKEIELKSGWVYTEYPNGTRLPDSVLVEYWITVGRPEPDVLLPVPR